MQPQYLSGAGMLQPQLLHWTGFYRTHPCALAYFMNRSHRCKWGNMCGAQVVPEDKEMIDMRGRESGEEKNKRGGKEEGRGKKREREGRRGEGKGEERRGTEGRRGGEEEKQGEKDISDGHVDDR